MALLAQALRHHPGATGLSLSRLTFEILGPIPLTPCEVEVEVLRPGKRIEWLKGTLRSEGRTCLVAHAWRLERVPGVVPAVPTTWVPPALPAHESEGFFPGQGHFPYGDALEWRFAEGGFAELGPATAWARPRIPLIDGQALDPLDRLLILMDSANGISGALDFQRYTFVPVELTLHLVRPPEGEWMGLAARTVIDGAGTGLVTSHAFDHRGEVGMGLHSLFVRPLNPR